MTRIVTVFNTKALRRGLTVTEQEYEVGHVKALRKQIGKYAPFASFECLTDVDIPGVKCIPLKHGYLGWWAKMEMFRPDFTGDFLFMDLDTVIVGDLSYIVAVDKLTLLRDFYRDGVKLKEGLGGGLCYLPEAERKQVWDFWIENPAARQREFPRGDQFLFEKFYRNTAARWQDEVPGQVVSYKVHCQNGVPPDARIVCFHGAPRPWEVGQFLHLYRDTK